MYIYYIHTMRKMGPSWVRKSGNYKDEFAGKYSSKETSK